MKLNTQNVNSRAITHSAIAATFLALMLHTPKTMANAISVKMNINLIQNDTLKTVCCRYLTPNRWYSAQRKIAASTYPTMKHARNLSCVRGKFLVSKIDKQISPIVPANAASMANADNNFSPQCVLGTSTPRCRSHRSAAKERSRKSVVTQDPTIKRGLSCVAPTSELGDVSINQVCVQQVLTCMQCFDWVPSIHNEDYRLRASRPTSLLTCLEFVKTCNDTFEVNAPIHTTADIIGNTQNDTNMMLY